MNPPQSSPMKPATCRTITSLMEELEAVDWYNQRVDACKDEELKDFLFYRQADCARLNQLVGAG